MDWKEINIPISSKISSEDIYKTFRNELEVEREYVLLALQNMSTKIIFYVTMQIKNNRKSVIIGGEELYCWYCSSIVAYCPIEPFSKKFCGEILINDNIYLTFDDEEKLISEYNRLISVKKEEFGEPEWDCRGYNRGCCSFVDTISGKNCFLSYKYN